MLAEAERAGGSIVRSSAQAEWRGTTGAFSDPDGYVWEVAHNPRMDDQHRRLNHNLMKQHSRAHLRRQGRPARDGDRRERVLSRRYT